MNMISLTAKSILILSLLWIPALIMFYFAFRMLKSKNKTVSRFYDHYYWCRTCQKWIPKEKAVQNENGKLLCPYCHKQVRTKARHYKRINEKKEKHRLIRELIWAF